jgi:hypothetical protein
MNREMRKQYYFQPSRSGLAAWDVDRLIRLTKDLPKRPVALSAIRELDAVWTGEDETPTWRAMIEHVRLIDAADLAFPIILSATGAVMDGMHRVPKVAVRGGTEIMAVQFESDPEPDHVGLMPSQLPY